MLNLLPLLSVLLQISNNLIIAVKICFLLAIILSWFPSGRRPTGVRKFVFQIATPLFIFARRWFPIKIGIIDLSPIILIIGFEVAQRILLAVALHYQLGVAGWWGV